MIATSVSSFRKWLPPVQESEIVLTWLTRLRWLAVTGQLSATGVAVFLLRLNPPLTPIASVIFITALTNAVIQRRRKLRRTVEWLVPGVLLLDVLLLTVLLMCTGGPANPFCVLYLVHVAMAVVALQEGWTWVVVATTVACYAAILAWHLPLSRGGPLGPWTMAVGSWSSLALVAALIAYFIGRVKKSLREHERTLGAIRETAAQNEKLAALTTLAAGAAHELNTPLATIAVVAKEMELGAAGAGGSGSGLADDARLIRQEVDRCKTILAGMRVDVLEGREWNSEPIAPREFLENLRRDLDPTTRRRVCFSCDEGLTKLVLPPRALQQAVGILVDNALSASSESSDQSDVSIEISQDSGALRIAVKDRGVGMSQEVIRRAGEPFFTTRRPGEGMGLGLFVVRMVCQRLGGRLEISSEPGRGTSASILLPGHGPQGLEMLKSEQAQTLPTAAIAGEG